MNIHVVFFLLVSSIFPIGGAHEDKNIKIKLNHVRDRVYGLNFSYTNNSPLCKLNIRSTKKVSTNILESWIFIYLLFFLSEWQKQTNSTLALS
jgi:hypothetical protein